MMRKAPRGRNAQAGRAGPAALAVATALLVAACYPLLPVRGGGQAEFERPREVDPADVAVPSGYRVEVVATGLSFPTGVAFDARGRPHVTEAGYSYGEVWATPRLVRVEPDGTLTEVAAGDDPPWNGLAFHDGAFYVAAAGHREGGRILRIAEDGEMEALVDGLPSLGDHHTNGPAVGPDGRLYFGQGTATNSGVVGLDNFDFGWVPRNPEFHDLPCRDVRLAGRNFRTLDPRPGEEERDGSEEEADGPETEGGEEAVTGAFVPFGTATESGQRVRGRLPCSGAVLRIDPGGGPLELVAWGFRNPFGLAFSPEGELFVTDNQYDVRGSRPVFGAGDLLWRVEPGRWYGWPDFHAGRPLADEDRYRPPNGPAIEPLLQTPPGQPPDPVARLAVHSSSNGLDFATDPEFGHIGDAFIAQFGDMAPTAGRVVSPVGFKVVRVDVETGVVHDFAVNREGGGPASRLDTGGLERPVAVRFAPDGGALYVVDFGVMTMEENPRPRLGTGVLWRITPVESAR